MRIPAELEELRRLEWVPLVLIYGFALWFMVALMDCRFIVGDEGAAMMDAWRVVEGQIPHRDFFEIYPPFSYLATALAFKLFGVGFQAERLLVLLYGILLILGADILLSQFTRSILARCSLVAFLVPFGVFFWPMTSHHWVVDLVQIFGLISLLLGLRSKRPLPWGVAGGVFTSLGCFTLQDQGGYLLVGLLLLFFPWVRDKSSRKRLFLGWAGGGLTVAASFAIYLLPHVSLSELLNQWLFFPSSRYTELAGNAPNLGSVLSSIASREWAAQVKTSPSYHLGMAGLTLVVFVLPAAAAIVLLTALRQKWRPGAEIGLIAAGCLAFLGGCLHRYALTNAIWAAPLPLVAVAWGLGRMVKSRKRVWVWSGVIAAVFIIVCSLAYAQAILRLTRGPAMIDVEGPAGRLRTISSAPEARIVPVIDAIEMHVPAGAPLFVTGYHPLVNFWSLRPNPSRFNYLVYPYNTAGQSAEVLEAVQSHPGTHVLVFYPVVDQDLVAQWALMNYEPVWRGPTAALMAPRQAPQGE